MKLTEALAAEYESMFASCRILPDRRREVETAAAFMTRNRTRYDVIGFPMGIPWWLVAVLHQMECGGYRDPFSRHLHNGDPLTARTVQVPAGRPVEGNPPFSFEASAVDALKLERHDRWHNWTVSGTLWRIEAYNGFGYRKIGKPSPYLWSFSQHGNGSGKFVDDGRFDPKAVSKQCGAAVLLRLLVAQALISIPVQSSVTTAEPVIGRVRVTGSTLNVRADASVSSPILTQVSRGDVLDVVRDGVEWTRVSTGKNGIVTGEKVGWVATRFVEKIK